MKRQVGWYCTLKMNSLDWYSAFWTGNNWIYDGNQCNYEFNCINKTRLDSPK